MVKQSEIWLSNNPDDEKTINLGTSLYAFDRGGNTKLWLAWKSSSVGVNDDTENKNLLFFYLIMVRCRVLNGFV